jgi:hypothetical protein
MNRIRTATTAILLASFLGLQPAPAIAEGQDHRDRSADQSGRRDDRREHRAVRSNRHDDRREHYVNGSAGHNGFWDPARYYRRDDRRYHLRRLGRNDVIYRGSDNRYYCRRDDGTTGLIVGGITGGVLGNIIAPGGSKTLGTILGAGAGALLGRAIDDGNVVCR